MLKSVLPKAGLWICPNTGHAINLEEPAPFNAQVESFLGAVERASRGCLKAAIDSSQELHRRICHDSARGTAPSPSRWCEAIARTESAT
jgi:hypothetical protein